MKERPILFSGPMVRATLREVDPKLQTRRVVKPQPRRVDGGVPFGDGPAWAHAEPGSAIMRCPYGVRGDRLWVREAWRAPLAYELTPPREIPPGTPIVYQADGAGSLPHFNAGKLRPGMFMPRWASRITLEVTGVRVERLQGISEADARAEGATPIPDPCDHVRLACADIGCSGPQPYRSGFRSLWESINGPGSLDANPLVWVVEFKRLEPSAC